MRLQKIKLAGFKSFVDVTQIPFPDNMTAIVGPNGCGKSNIIDAVRWVLGESSAKNLRGDAMTDVIFNGSSARKPVSQCSVELVFDNSSGRVQGEYAKYTELSVKRLVSRDGQSLYFLNGSKCRRRDITDIFLGTGLGPRSYAIIEQGMISRLIESKPQELRVFIEEAAGISKYKERRRETENRIRHTRENLERLLDVRAELAKQLEKLQRQAAAAKRYKQFKSRERVLKGELATMRWLKHSEQVIAYEEKIKQQETDIEAYIAQQRGGEKNMAVYQQQQHDLNAELQDRQTELFKVGTEISRLQQSQLHNQQRKSRIGEELSQLQQVLDDAVLHQQQQLDALQRSQQLLAQREPELEILDEAQLEAQERVLEAEENYEQIQLGLRESENEFSGLRHQIDSRKNQLQALKHVLQRGQIRLQQVDTELAELDIVSHKDVVDQARLQRSQTEQRLAAQLLAVDEKKLTLQSSQQQVQNEQSKAEQLSLKLQQINGELMAIESVLNSHQNPLKKQLSDDGVDYLDIASFLQVEGKWAAAVDVVLGYWHGACVVDSDVSLPRAIQGKAWFSQGMSEDKPKGTLASCILSPQVPECLSKIHLCEDDGQLQELLSNLKIGESVITPEGQWYSHEYCLVPSSEPVVGPLQHQQHKQRLLQQQQEQQQLLDTLQQELKTQQQGLADMTDALAALNQQVLEEQRQLHQFTTDFNHHTATLATAKKRQEMLQDEQQSLTLQLEEEALQQEALYEEIEQLEYKFEDYQGQQDSNEQVRQQCQQTISLSRSQYQNAKDAYHRVALELEALKVQCQGLLTSQQREAKQVEAFTSQQSVLREELNTLTEPDEIDVDELEQLLTQKLEIEEQQVVINSKLAELDGWLSDAEKGQRGVQQKVEGMRAELERSKLDCEGQRIRANGILEQLTELNQSLKSVLESLPDEAQEQPWQAELESVQRGLSRLGAVNLAAVEEYEQQLERKTHLDSQYDDLTAALDTLENAIRKIDKETRSRFKQTFEQVNSDLKILFPKVFGGGAAYLDLTDNDMLDTGVTIMARPPGKKNSTIHLLSGGEKALTALSLVFAIFRLNPAPFCLLDEVDAPLDDANVQRFCNLVTEMSQTVQFIYISHNKIAMEMANHLTGVTMAEPGVSRMVSVTVDEAASMIEE